MAGIVWIACIALVHWYWGRLSVDAAALIATLLLLPILMFIGYGAFKFRNNEKWNEYVGKYETVILIVLGVISTLFFIANLVSYHALS